MFICGAGGWWPANSGLLYLGWFDSFICLVLPTSISVAFPSFDVCSPCQAWTISLACSFRMSCLPSSLGYQMFPHFHGWGRGNDNLEAHGSQRHCFFMILIFFHFDLFRHWRNMKKSVGTCYYQHLSIPFPVLSTSGVVCGSFALEGYRGAVVQPHWLQPIPSRWGPS
jgi:hypothetical protein